VGRFTRAAYVYCLSTTFSLMLFFMLLGYIYSYQCNSASHNTYCENQLRRAELSAEFKQQGTGISQ
jgi:hypothetical protein